jgi:hypothetical protein
MFQTKVAEKIKTHVLCSIFFLNRALCEIMWKTFAVPGGTRKILWHIRIACWIPMATHTQSECVILTAFPQQQWLHAIHTVPVLFPNAVHLT